MSKKEEPKYTEEYKKKLFVMFQDNLNRCKHLMSPMYSGVIDALLENINLVKKSKNNVKFDGLISEISKFCIWTREEYVGGFDKLEELLFLFKEHEDANE